MQTAEETAIFAFHIFASSTPHLCFFREIKWIFRMCALGFQTLKPTSNLKRNMN